MTEVSVKLTDISDPSRSLDEIRRLNDEISKLQREKRAWEHHIKKLGGTDYIRFGKQEGIFVNGVRYYGRARELPEAQKKEKTPKEAREEHHVPLSYYGSFGQDEKDMIVADERYIQGEINQALGEELYPVPSIAKEEPDMPTNEDVKRMLLERQKALLRAQLGA